MVAAGMAGGTLSCGKGSAKKITVAAVGSYRMRRDGKLFRRVGGLKSPTLWKVIWCLQKRLIKLTTAEQNLW